jgi:archaellum component FlaC
MKFVMMFDYVLDILSIHRRKQIEEISNNIQEARRIFERLESDTRRLVLVRTSSSSIVSDCLSRLFYS